MLTGGPPERETFDHVILAIPQAPLMKLSSIAPRAIQSDLTSVIGFPLLKSFLTTATPWWEAYWKPQGESRNDNEAKGLVPFLSQRNALSLPTREVHYFYRERDGHGMAMLYTDRPATEFWRVYLRDWSNHSSAEVYEKTRKSRLKLEDNAPLLDELVRYLAYESATRARDEIDRYSSGIGGAARAAQTSKSSLTKVALAARDRSGSVHPSSTRGTPAADGVTGFAIRDWSAEPFGAGCHAWRPGFESTGVRDRLKGFSIAGKRAKSTLHVCGEAYSDYQGFIEGALNSASAAVVSIVANI